MNSYVRVHFSSHSWMKSITSPTISGNSFNVCRSSSELGTFLSLSSWLARILMLSVRLFIASWDSSWVLRCCQIYQSYYSCRKQKRSSPGMRDRRKKTQFSLQNLACSSQIRGMCAFQGWFTSLIVFPISINISAPSFVGPRRLKMDLNLSKFSIVLLKCIPNAIRVESKAYNWTWVGKFYIRSNQDSIPQRRATAVILEPDHRILPWSLLRYSEYIESDQGKDQLTFCFLLWFWQMLP